MASPLWPGPQTLRDWLSADLKTVQRFAISVQYFFANYLKYSAPGTGINYRPERLRVR
jgi:hypothetical protein